ncbi:MAG: potassium-transporting ATPase subunit C [Gemmataceae bacterium]
MKSHLRGNLWLLGLTLLFCSVLYPAALWVIAQIPGFKDKAEGSLITDSKGHVIGSRLIAQPFTSDAPEYFQPRPSAVSYAANASGGTNWGASNYALRERVARALGPIVRYGKKAETPGAPVQPAIEEWFQKDRYQKQPGIVAQWADMHAGSAEARVKSTGDTLKRQWKEGDKEKEPNEAFVLSWQADLPELYKEWIAGAAYREWKAKNNDVAAPSNADIAKEFFPAWSKKFPGQWPVLDDYETPAREKRKRIIGAKEGSDVQSVFFEMWRQENPDVSLEDVPADMVMASGSGLDPHITLANAEYQLKYRVAAARADKITAAFAKAKLEASKDLTEKERKLILDGARKALDAKAGGDLEALIKKKIEELFEKHREAPLGGLVGVGLVNVLELNLAVDAAMDALVEKWG